MDRRSKTDSHLLAPFAVRLRKAAELAKGKETVTSYLATAPDGTAPSQAAVKLFPKHYAPIRFAQRFRLRKDLYEGHGEPSAEDLEIAASAGKWSTRPSDLFLKMFADCLVTLQRNPLAGVVSPPLLGSEGTIPLSIVSVIPDIMQHYYDCIVRAKHEVILLTNYWQPSNSVRKIGAAMRELSKRAGAAGTKAVFKLLIDRGAIQQIVNPHVPVPCSQWKALEIPLPDEIPNVLLEVQNYHRIAVGTMHTKFLVIDRTVACINSNNIQDRPNLEMMIHLEGPIVQSFYDAALITWFESSHTMLPLLKQPLPPFEYSFADNNPYLADIDLVKAAKTARLMLGRQHADLRDAGVRRAQSKSSSFAEVVAAMQASTNKSGANLKQAMTSPISIFDRSTTDSHSLSAPSARTPPELIVSAPSNVRMNGGPPNAGGSEAPLDAVSRPSEIESDVSPPETAKSIVSSVPHTPSEVSTAPTSLQRSVSGSPPAVRRQPSVIENPGRTMGSSSEGSREMGTLEASELSQDAFQLRMRALSTHFNRGANAPTDATLPLDQYDDNRQFAAHRFHRPHKPVPIALVNRKPHGMPGHRDIRNPQDAAWLAAFRYAEKHVFIQTPTLNAAIIRDAIIKACRRKIKVILYLDLGFNDKSEAFPFQGGTNQNVVKQLYAALDRDCKEYFELYWYCGADQIRPLHAIHKRRNCHVKFMSVDSKVAIVGNGNLDTQSVCHSQEVNIMIDSEQIVQDWEAMLAANQNTGRFGKTHIDGIWRDPMGRTVEELDLDLAKQTPKGSQHDKPVAQKKEVVTNDAA